MASAVYLKGQLDIQIAYESDPAVTWTILDSAGSAYSFASKTDSDLNIYDRKGGTLLKNYGESATEGLSYSSNAITWNAAWYALPLGFYYYEITYEDSGTVNPTQKVVDGYIEIL